MDDEVINIEIIVSRNRGEPQKYSIPRGAFNWLLNWIEKLKPAPRFSPKRSLRTDDIQIDIVREHDPEVETQIVIGSEEQEVMLLPEYDPSKDIVLTNDKGTPERDAKAGKAEEMVRLVEEPITDTDLYVVLRKQALKKVKVHAKEDLSREVGGVLLGKFLHGKKHKRLVVVTGIVRALEAVGRATSLNFTPDSWAAVWRIIDKHQVYSNEEIWSVVGWYHTHPRFGIFMSELDKFIHGRYFTRPGHVALVVDPVKDEHGFFYWDKGKDPGEIVECLQEKVCEYDEEKLLEWLTRKVRLPLAALPPSEIEPVSAEHLIDEVDETHQLREETSPEDDERIPSQQSTVLGEVVDTLCNMKDIDKTEDHTEAKPNDDETEIYAADITTPSDLDSEQPPINEEKTVEASNEQSVAGSDTGLALKSEGKTMLDDDLDTGAKASQ